MVLKIRAASSQDALNIAEIIELTFDEKAHPSHITRVLKEDEHLTLVAQADTEAVAGFIDGFLTLARDGIYRWELDLLAVHPMYRKRGIGQQLIQKFTESGSESGAVQARALVAVDNQAMSHAMRRTGYVAQADICELWTASASVTKNMNSPQNAYLIPVTTLTYRGLWIETTVTPAAVQTALYARTQHNLDLVGTVVPANNQAEIRLMQIAGFQKVGSYQWWLRQL